MKGRPVKTWTTTLNLVSIFRHVLKHQERMQRKILRGPTKKTIGGMRWYHLSLAHLWNCSTIAQMRAEAETVPKLRRESEGGVSSSGHP